MNISVVLYFCLSNIYIFVHTDLYSVKTAKPVSQENSKIVIPKIREQKRSCILCHTTHVDNSSDIPALNLAPDKRINDRRTEHRFEYTDCIDVFRNKWKIKC